MITTTPRPVSAPPRPRRNRGRWRRRWYRVAVPFAVLAVLVTVTLVARATQEPDLDDAGTLSPVGTGQDGSSELARMLDEQGVRVEYVTDIEAAESAARTFEDSVVFIPRPTTFGLRFAAAVRSIPGSYRVVLVAPNERELSTAGATVVSAGPSRWATKDAAPGCDVPEAVAAGRAGVLRNRYAVEGGQRCYGGGLVQFDFPGTRTELFVAGSADPFRNRRIHEHGNAELATGLLSAHDRVIWLGALPYDPDYRPDGDLGDIDIDLPDVERPEVDAPQRGTREAPGDNTVLGRLEQMYGPAAPAGMALAILVAVLVALAMARRLGTPVSEPLPVVVPAAEAVAGRGRLYQRTRDHGVAMAALRTAAIRRLAPAVGLPATPPPEPDDLVAAVVTRTGMTEADVRRTLYGPEPTTDEQLTAMVADLDALVRAVTREGGPS